ncbi:MAG: bifunctional chorismate mutase/prephenate dehydratase [Oscillospiraceae bacterium]|nr:bifunctional chorismate mutase/prephenate dehydratase [Oscillospiraceae bacterium]
MNSNERIEQKIKYALQNTQESLPLSPTAACQGAEGAYSQFACEALFSKPGITHYDSFEAVFEAVDKGMCDYGILPLENSLQGTVTEVYDLMSKYNFYIVRSVKMKINHALLANKGVIAPQIKEIHSHEQALGQCSDFIKKLQNVKIVKRSNTAKAARYIAESGRTDAAAIASLDCAKLYGLSVISQKIQNNDHNYTRFVCISKEPEIYPGADRISLVFATSHKPGSLYKSISKFADLGVNLTKLESRPIPGEDFEYRFHIELDSPITDEILSLIDSLDKAPEKFAFLGNYSEIKSD